MLKHVPEEVAKIPDHKRGEADEQQLQTCCLHVDFVCWFRWSALSFQILASVAPPGRKCIVINVNLFQLILGDVTKSTRSWLQIL